ncbi:hypothetical protein RRG08_037697 [Elysia crispata]|uniref:Uncharacterized protein n=1 Tax=Elysia crispata TaxID=231223 RepID=A0AAE1A7H9_9GAST|nr:hypothetical protein RRG08_037697 [Elysia crispata]
MPGGLPTAASAAATGVACYVLNRVHDLTTGTVPWKLRTSTGLDSIERKFYLDDFKLSKVASTDEMLYTVQPRSVKVAVQCVSE